MVGKKAIYISVLTVGLIGFAGSGHAFLQSYGFFDASAKYREWFNETTWKVDTVAYKKEAAANIKLASNSLSEKYPYPTRELVVTKKMWKKSFDAVESGDSDWFDVEVVRQRAEMEGHPPAMDFLAWMYENGQGMDRDHKKAFMWYERAKLSGQEKLRGSAAKIFQRLNDRDRYFATLQLKEDIERLNPAPEVVSETLRQVNLHVFDERRDPRKLKEKPGTSR